MPKLVEHEYQFINDDVFARWVNSTESDIRKFNTIICSEFLDKAHLASTVALFRSLQWVEASIAAYEQGNLFSWASSVRGLVENAGDIMDGLLNTALSLAENVVVLSEGISGLLDSSAIDMSELERTVDHFILAKWMRAPKTDVRKAKENIEYVKQLESAHIPGVMDLYHRLCSIVHPSSSSIDFLYLMSDKGLKLSLNAGKKAINEIIEEFPDVLPQSLTAACNPPLLVLRVLHRFKIHPRLLELRDIDWSPIPIWEEINKNLLKSRF